MRNCGACKEAKPEAEFYVDKKGRDGLGYRCKPCAKAAAAETRRKNPERQAIYNARHGAARASWRERNKLHRAAYGSKYQRENRARLRELERKYRQADLPKAIAKCAERRARRANATPAWANEFFIAEIYDLAVRRSNALGISHHVDHIVPLKSPLVCGLHCEQNLRVIPARSNLQKSNINWPDMPERSYV